MPFSDAAWSSPESDLDADDYCSVCLIDLNMPGQDKVKAKCKLPVRSRPGGPINKHAMSAAVAALAGARGGIDAPPTEKRRAARKLIRMMGEAGMPPNENMRKMSGG